MQIPVNQIVNVEPNNYQGLTKTTFLSSASNNQPVYLFHQPQNAPQVGGTLDGTLAPDRSGKLKFTKTPNPQYQNQSQNYQQGGGSLAFQMPSATSSTPSVTSSTDPRQESIEKQAYFKAAIDLYTIYTQQPKVEGQAPESLETFAQKIVKLALQVKRQMKDNANGDVVPQADDLIQLGDVFGPGSAEVLPEGPNGL